MTQRKVVTLARSLEISFLQSRSTFPVRAGVAMQTWNETGLPWPAEASLRVSANGIHVPG